MDLRPQPAHHLRPSGQGLAVHRPGPLSRRLCFPAGGLAGPGAPHPRQRKHHLACAGSRPAPRKLAAGPRPPGGEPPPCRPARRRPVGAEPHVPLRGAPRPAGHSAFGGAQRDRRPAPSVGKSPGHVPGPGGLGRPGPHHPAPGGQRRHRRRGSAGGGGPAVPGPAAGRRGPGAPLRRDAVGLRPRRSGPAGGPAGGLARLPLPEAGGQRQLHPPLRLGQGGYLDPFPRRQPGRRPRPRGPAPRGCVPRRGGRPDRRRPGHLHGRRAAPRPERPRRPQYLPGGRRRLHLLPRHLGVGAHRPAPAGPGALHPAGGPPRRGAPGVSGSGRGGGAAAGLSQAGAAGGGGHPPRPGRPAPPGRAVLPLRPGPADGRGERRPLGGRAHLRPAPLAQRAAGRMFRRALRPRLQPGGRCPGPPAGRPGCGRRDGPGVGAQSGRPLPGGACAGVHRGRPAPPCSTPSAWTPANGPRP